MKTIERTAPGCVSFVARCPNPACARRCPHYLHSCLSCGTRLYPTLREIARTKGIAS